MEGDDDFRLRFGRPGDKGKENYKRYGARVRKAAARNRRPSGKPNFTGRQFGRGSAAGRLAAHRKHPFQRHRMRRVIVKMHIARAKQGIGKAAYRAHLKYVQRDGVDRDGNGGELYDREHDKITDADFLERSEDDRHQFRVVLSPEDGDKLDDLKAYTRDFMERVERDLETKLDWVAVDHYNTGHPHTHIVIRGKDELGRDLVIAPDYIRHGLRHAAQELVMERLGPRRDLEIAQSRQSEINKERFTGIDREIAELTRNGSISIDKANGVADRFKKLLQLQRLKQLELMELAASTGPRSWALKDGWDDTLKRMGKRGDIVRSIAAAMGEAQKGKTVSIFEAGIAGQPVVTGRLACDGPGDELRDTRFIVVDGVDGNRWYADLMKQEPGTIPKVGAIVELKPRRTGPKKADRTIAKIAALNGGVYSDEYHRIEDQNSTEEYRQAHKRRLEALRRAGLVERLDDGSWKIAHEFLGEAERFERMKSGGASLVTKSWIDLDEQTNRRAATWLDQLADDAVGKKGFGKDVAAAKRARMGFLKREGLWNEKTQSFDQARASALAAEELHRTGAAIANVERLTYVAFDGLESFSGDYRRPVNLAHGRFAIVQRSKEFTLVPWRASLEKHRGRSLVARHAGRGVSFEIGKTKGIGR